MEKCKWDFFKLNHYFRFTEYNVFKIIGKREGQWRTVFSIKF